MREHEKRQQDTHPSAEEEMHMPVPRSDLERLLEALSHLKTASDQQINDTISSIVPDAVVAPTRFASVKVLAPITGLVIVTGEAFIEFTAASGPDGFLVFTLPQDNTGTPLLFQFPIDASVTVFPTLIIINSLLDSGSGLLGAGVMSATAVALADRVLVLSDLLVSGNSTFFRSVGFQATIIGNVN